MRCFSAFRLLLNPKKTCDLCKSYVCKKCCQTMKNNFSTTTSVTRHLKQQQQQKLLICFVCYKKKLLETSASVNRSSCAPKVKKKSAFNSSSRQTLDESFLSVRNLSFFKRRTGIPLISFCLIWIFHRNRILVEFILLCAFKAQEEFKIRIQGCGGCCEMINLFLILEIYKRKNSVLSLVGL